MYFLFPSECLVLASQRPYYSKLAAIEQTQQMPAYSISVSRDDSPLAHIITGTPEKIAPKVKMFS